MSSISKSKYRQLERQANILREIKTRFFELTSQDPIEGAIADFWNTGKYSKAFLKDLESGLRLSSHQ